MRERRDPLEIASTVFFRKRARRTDSPLDLPVPDTARFLAEDLAFAAAAWTMRAEEEHRSAATFAGLAHALIRSGSPLDIADAALCIARDEVRHAAMCAELARRFGAPSPCGDTARDVPHRESPAALRRVVLSIWLLEGAIGETVSSALFARGRNLATEPCTRAALGLILRDEVMHARTSWEALSALTKDASDEERAWLHDETRRALGLIEQTQMVPVLRRLERAAPFSAPWAELGVLPPETRVEVFYAAIEQRVRRELERLGIDFGTAWTNRYRGD